MGCGAQAEAAQGISAPPEGGEQEEAIAARIVAAAAAAGPWAGAREKWAR